MIDIDLTIEDLHLAMGVSEERETVLKETMQKAYNRLFFMQGPNDDTHTDDLQVIKAFIAEAKTPNELAFCMYQAGRCIFFMEHRGLFISSAPFFNQ